MSEFRVTDFSLHDFRFDECRLACFLFLVIFNVTTCLAWAIYVFDFRLNAISCNEFLFNDLWLDDLMFQRFSFYCCLVGWFSF